MKKFYLLFLLTSSLSLILISFFNHRKEYLSNDRKFNNLENLIKDSITPTCSENFFSSYKNSKSYNKEINIIIPKSRKWERNLNTAFTNNSGPISAKFKKRFDANIYLNNSKNDLCKLAARVRLSGDGKDHIQKTNKYILSSLDVSLINGNVNGITKFKLFLPSTRSGSAEVFISLLLKEMGYISPRTELIKVNLNTKPYEMIFQEKAAKEMLEDNRLRESAIIQSDESLMWEIRSKYGPSKRVQGQNFNGYIFPKIVNEKWIKRNLINQEIGLEGSKIFSEAILDIWNHGGIEKEISFSDNLLSNGNKINKGILSRFKAHLIASGSEHALYNHNRRFYYDPINKSLLPIYYDGNSRILNPDSKFTFLERFKNQLLTRDIKTKDFNFAINELKAINLSKFSYILNNSGVDIGEAELLKIQTQLIENLISLRENNQIYIKSKFRQNPLITKMKKNTKYGFILYSRLDKNFYLCNPEENKCIKTKLEANELNNLLTGKYNKNEIQYYFLGEKFDPVTKEYYNETDNEVKNKLNLLKIGRNIYIKKFGNPLVKVNEKDKVISIQLSNPNEKILIFDSKLKDWDIKVLANKNKNIQHFESRIDSNLLTSLLTIKDSQIDNIKIYIEGGTSEDSLNIINSVGSIQKIDVKTSFQDAVDFDFSNLVVEEIIVNNAGNDCFDASSGTYSITKLNFNGCEDKGVSVGEKSDVILQNAQIQNTNIALVSKDFSKLIVKNTTLKNNNLCAAAYNKKQEFGPSYISIPKRSCPKSKLAIQNLSILKYQ